MTTVVTIELGGTGATHAAGAREALSVPSMEQMGHSYAQANSARDQANTAYGAANTAETDALNAYSQANSARGQANSAYGEANLKLNLSGGTLTGNLNVSATLITQNIVPDANVTYSIGTPTNRFKDLWLAGSTIYLGDTVLSAAGDEMRANTFNAATSFISAGLNVLDQANSARNQANTAREQANNARSDANTTFGTINTTFGTVNTSLGTINTNYQAAYAQANTARDQANTAYTQANNARSDANTTFSTINTTFGTVNTSLGTINTNYQAAYAQANTARGTANDAYATANTKLSTSGGSISGDLSITGNLTVQGNATTINVSNLAVNDSIILLATGGTGDSTDIGFIGHFERNSVNTHAGLIRKATENRFYLFDNYEVEPTNNVIDVAGQNFRVGNLRLGIINANSYVTSAGLDVTAQANAAYAQANSARDQANTGYGQANAARNDANTTFATINTTFATLNTSAGTQNTAITTANDQANTARSQANTARDTANSSYGQANTATTNAGNAYGQANTATTNAGNAYGTANTAATNALNAYGQANAAYGQANSAYGAANNRVLKAGDTMTGGLIIQADASNEQFTIKRATNTNEQLIFGFHSSDYGSIQAVEQNVAYRPLILNKDGGDVAIGAAPPAFTSGSGLEIQRATATATLRLDSSSFATELYGYTGGTGLFQLSAGYLDLGTNNTTRLRIDANGNVSIGTTSAVALVQIQNGNSTYTSPENSNVPVVYVRNTNNASTSAHAIVNMRTQPSGGNPFVSYDIEGVIGWSHGIDNADSDKFKINRGWSSLTTDTKLTIDASGNVGIGSASPTCALDVTTSGRIRSGGLYGTSGNGNIPIWQYDSGNLGYGIMYFEAASDYLKIDVSGSLVSGTPDFQVSPDAAYVNGNLVWHQGNDGSGSGLDADLWDGYQFTDYLNQAVKTTSSPTFSNMTVTGYFTNIRNNASVSAPSTSDHSLGTRLTLYDANATAWYAIGIESDTMWFNSDTQYKWYVDAAQKMILDSSGNLTPSGRYYGNITSSGTGDSNAPFIFNADYSAWASHWAGTPGSNNGWGLFWAGNSGAQYGTNGTGGPGNIWSNSGNPNEAVFVGNGSTDWTLQLNAGNVWQKGTFYCAGDVYTSYSDKRLKDIIGPITNAVEKIKKIDTIYYTANELAKSLGVQEKGTQVGVTSQSVKEVLPEVVVQSPVNVDYDTVQYERLVPLLIAAIKEQQEQIEELKKKLGV